jgi:methylated-DNA-[protein]-cysteine S-methyltransferase
MAPQRITLRARVAGALADATNAHPGLTIEGFPMGRRLLLTCRGAYPGDAAFANHLGLAPERLHSTGSNGVRTLMLAGQGHVDGLIRVAEEADAVLVPPLVWSRGEVVLNLVAGDPRAVVRISAALGGARIESKRSLAAGRRDGRASDDGALLGRLTRRQAQALTAALGSGYYESPRRVTTEEVARSMGVTRSTYEEHLRAAESHVVKALAPLVRLRGSTAEAPAGEALEVYARFSRELGLYVHLTLREGRVAAVRLTEQEPAAPAQADHPYLARLLEHLATGEGDLRDIPVDLDLGPFERRVLEALRDIPAGQVLTYGELARRLGHARAARAVGNALAKNPIPLILPCHRVVPSTGGVGNYSGGKGSETKRRLLEREGALRRSK